MSKWSKYNKNFQHSWLSDKEFRKWIEEVKGDSEKAYCKLCKVQLRAHKTDLNKHASTAKHIKNVACVFAPTQQKLTTICSQKGSVTTLELKLAAFTACHTSIRNVDHLTELVKCEFPSSNSASMTIDTKKLNIHRTKCSAIIKNVIAPALMQELIEDVHDQSYSLIIDESTDISCVKHLCLCIRYYSSKENRIVSQFLGLIPVIETTAESLYEATTKFLSEVGVDIKHCFAIATDGASNLCGIKNSLYTRMKEVNPNILLLKCICHSLHLTCSHASEELPGNIDYLLRETYNWFHRSALRCNSYMEIYKLINDGEEPLKILPLSPTRWLARSNCVKRVLQQWDTLQLHFKMVSSHCDRYYARELSNMYSDPSNKLYLTFLTPILTEFEKVNLLFQKEIADACGVLEDLRNFALSLLRRVLPHSHVTVNAIFNDIDERDFLSYENADLGYEFSNLLAENLASGKITAEQRRFVQQRCYQFLRRACKELCKRIPGNMETLLKIYNLCPKICLSHTRPSFSALPLELCDQSQIGEIENQWRLLLTIKWENFFPDEIPTDGVDFWCKAITTKNSAGDCLFKELSTFALTMYSLPISNATVERVFSRVTATKTKLRSRMGLNLLSSIIRIKMVFEDKNVCCYNFTPSTRMLKYDSSIYLKDTAEQEGDDAAEVLSAIDF